ncbi:MAG TPA: PD-(D/E)XK nuclease family protein, partial [Tichowtungia sp.]|nr:PD-(D/E)XK nuclease family protein [Tichowtungia sp.]
DRLCDLLLSPGIDWPGVEDREALVNALRKSAPPRLHRLPQKLSEFFKYSATDSFSEMAKELIKKHEIHLPDEVLGLIDELNQTTEGLLDSKRMISLFEKLLDNITLKDEQSTEAGVWIVNPMDAAGLRFKTVFIAGMDDRTFPQIPKANPLLNSKERAALRAFLEERNIPCPRLALSETNEALIQEEILFLTALSCATEKLQMSYTRTDADGKERAPGEFFERMCALAQCNAPQHGESFHTILPPEAVRAEDEVRQTAAWISKKSGRGFQPLASGRMPLPQSVISIIQQWLKNNTEFSATALESLARNRFVFFLEKVLGIKPDRTHEDDTDPMDRGSLIHDILEQVYHAIAEQGDWVAQRIAGVPPALWKLSQQKTDTAIPLAVFDPSKEEEYLAMAREIAE